MRRLRCTRPPPPSRLLWLASLIAETLSAPAADETRRLRTLTTTDTEVSAAAIGDVFDEIAQSSGIAGEDATKWLRDRPSRAHSRRRGGMGGGLGGGPGLGGRSGWRGLGRGGA